MKKEKINRVIIYIVGMLILALGLTLNTKTNMGVSPIISVAYCVSTLTKYNVGDLTLVWYILFVLIEMICHICLKRYKIIVVDLMQIPLSIVFTRFMNLFSNIIPNMTDLPVRVIYLLLAVFLTGTGIGLTLNMRLIPNPGDGIVQAISDCTGKPISTIKNILDAVCVIITIAISLLFTGKIIGIGFGTIFAVIFVGRVVALFHRFFQDRIIKLAGLKIENKN